MAASLHCNTTQGHISEIHGIFSGAVGMGLSTSSALTLGTPCTPHGAGCCGQGSPGHICTLCHHPPLGTGTRGILQCGGPHQVGSHPIPSHSSQMGISPLPHCTFCSWRGLGAVALPRALGHPWREPPMQILLAGAVGCSRGDAAVMAQEQGGHFK